MAGVSGQMTTLQRKNYVGQLFYVTPTQTKFLNMIGSLSGGRTVKRTVFTWQDIDNATRSQDTKLEGADATFASRTRSEYSNVLQIHQEGFEISYTAEAIDDQLHGESILGNQPVRSERSVQARLKLQKIAGDVNYSFLRGTYADPADPTAAARGTRGLQNAIATNTVAAGALDFAKAHLQELSREMVNSGAPLLNTILLANAWNRQKISEAYGYAPESRNVGGLNIHQIEHEFDVVGVTHERDMPTDEIYYVDLALCAPVFLKLKDGVSFTAEPLAKTGSANKWQWYGEVGLFYGPEEWHGSITGTTTS